MSIRRERRDAVEHRKLILQTAQQLFHQHGVQPVSMHQIAKTAGIGQATLYRRYAHKGDLCMAMLVDFAGSLAERVEAFLESHRSSSPLDRVSGIVDAWIDAIEEQSELILEMESYTSCDSERGNFFLSPLYRFFCDKFSSVFDEIAEAKRSTAIDGEFAAHAMICALSPMGYFHLKQGKGMSTEEIKQHYRRMTEMFLS
ncbi:TetR/AcrR family transcriptional regulator [Cohnella suwonensis]|uniref:TetR/AcrR family transcriptional regulator n=1 Tax=Cohnella suwonensis TaxID=696072 RepID=A0ABW0LX89_9BACL